ncbi:FAD-dependent oxidoreductase [Gorillibacterium sp. sgz5001074]|uniref:FAD-dependent oxidoreductase n=1 Tax=Gorillibacterium sp. sgz5001074 TaxID=3446695 RepID=UPI003F673818
MLRNKWTILALTFILLGGIGGPFMYWKEKYGGGLNNETMEAQELLKVDSVKAPKEAYDVIVVGTDPEGVAGAVSAARNGLKTLLVDGRNRDILGGLMSLGWLNSLDNNYDVETYDWLAPKPNVLNKGIFQEFYDKVEGTSFDVVTAANVFRNLVAKEKNIEVLLKTQAIEPVTAEAKDGNKRIEALTITLENGEKRLVKAKAVLDATQDADIAAAAGAPFSRGREDLGDPKSLMAVTAVFRLKNADDAFWKEVRKKMENDNDPDTGADVYSAWGYKDIKDYKPQDPAKARMRGLNIGRQNNGTILINALQLFGVDPTNPESVKQAYETANKELPHILAFIKSKHPEFDKLELDGTAPELYVRETRHIYGEYRLTILDLLESRDQWDRVGFGSYAVDIQSTGPADFGAVAMVPDKYAVPFRSLVPLKVDGLLVTSRSASYDTLPHGSARVIPLGMAVAQSAGAAAKVAIDNNVSFRELSKSKDLVAKMQDLVNGQGMDLKPYTPKVHSYMNHKAYPGLKAAVYMGLVNGSYGNLYFKDEELNKPSNPQRFVNHLRGAKRMYAQSFKGDATNAIAGMTEEQAKTSPLTLQQAAYSMARASGLTVKPEQAEQELTAKRLLKPETVKLIANKQSLTNGEAYLLIKDLTEGLVNVRF